MARAKRTDRAEARRQYRAYLASQQEAEAAAEAEGAAEESQSRPPLVRRPNEPAAGNAPRPGGRMSFFGAAKAATRSATYVKDLRDIVWLVTRTRAVWPSALICVVAVAIAYPRIHSGSDYYNDSILQLVFQFVLNPQLALLPPMLAGFMAPRATWLAGAIAAGISTILFIFVLATTPLVVSSSTVSPSASPAVAAATQAPSAAAATAAPSPTSSTTGTSTTISAADLGIASLAWLFQSMLLGAVIGAGSGWYKRFLDNIGPRGGAPRKPQPKRPVKRGQPVRR